LAEAFEAVASGRGGVVSVVGEAGLGKSRLLAEALERADADALRWLEGRSLSIGRNLPFHPFADVLRGFAGVTPDLDEAAAAARVRDAIGARLGDAAGEVVPYVLTIMALPLLEAEREQVARLEGDAMENLVRRALTRLLRALAEDRPLVLVLDDLHWADLSSIDLLDSLLRLAESHPVLFVNLARDGFTDTSGRILATARASHAERLAEIALQPLGTEACRLLIRNLFRGADVPHDLRTTLEERAAGNPFFVEEVVRSLLDQGALALDHGALRATERIDAAEIPGTIQEVVMSRVDRLPPERRQLLQVASALGASFEPEILAAALGKESLDDRLADLVAAGLLLAAAPRYEFKHPLIQEVAYDSIVEARRAELHHELGVAIEQTLSDRAPGYHARLAYHYGRGHDAERAEAHLFRAGEEAAGASASNEALHFFQEASARYFERHGEGGDPEKKARLAAQVAHAQANRGLLLEAVAHYDQALGHLGERTPGRVELALRLPPLAIGLLARLYWPQRRQRPADDTERQVIGLMYDRAQAETTTSPTRFVYDTMRVLRNLQRVDPRSVDRAGGILASAVGTFAFGGVSFAVGHKFLERAEPFVERDDRREVLLFGMMRFLLHFLEGDWDDVHGVAEDLLEEGRNLGALWEVANFLDLDTERRIYRGEFDEARARIEEIGRIVDAFQYDLARASHGALSTYLHIERGELEQALDSADHYFDEHAEDSFQVLALGARAKAEVGLGRLDAAGDSLSRAERVIERSGSLLPFHRSSYLRSRALLDVARLEADASAGRAARRAARKSVGRALGVAKVVASRRPEVYKLAGL
ncbi:MAG: AAA family ATPase, partial [Myxococcales bacterium]|nr:AAA family ATPase [Myxococcales bacterium]